MLVRSLLLALAALAPAAARANDSIAELGTGGLVLTGTDRIALDSERLRISADAIAVDYVFRNLTTADITAEVAFPMPDLTGGPDAMVALPDRGADNFLDFSVTQDGATIAPQLDQRAFLGDRAVTDKLRDAGVPLMPLGDATTAALSALPRQQADALRAAGLVQPVEYDAGQGRQTDLVPLWTLRSTFHWRTTFPAGKPVRVAHRYRPSVGGSVGLNFIDYATGKVGGEAAATYRRDYCMDGGFVRAVERVTAGGGAESAMRLYETRIAYVLGTGGSWAGGRIGDFRLEVDKGRPDALVSFCGTGVEKTGPTTFRMHVTDYAPPDMLHVLILMPQPEDPGG